MSSPLPGRPRGRGGHATATLTLFPCFVRCQTPRPSVRASPDDSSFSRDRCVTTRLLPTRVAISIFRLVPERKASRQADSDGVKDKNRDISSLRGSACLEVLD